WHVVRTWAGDKQKECQFKSASGARYCPECSEHPLLGFAPRRTGATYLTRRQRALRQQERERVPLGLLIWRDERTPVPVTAEEWHQQQAATLQAITEMTPQQLAAAPPWHPAADFRAVILSGTQTALAIGGDR